MYHVRLFENTTWKRLLIPLMALFILILSGCHRDSPTKGGPVSDETQTLKSLEKINDYPFYTMSYYGDYGFREYLDTGIMPSFFTLPAVTNHEFSCTCFAAFGSDSCQLFGRNFDWTTHIALLLYSNSSDGYASVSMVLLQHLGYSNTNTPDVENNRQALLAVPYFPMDGLNEKGVAIGIMAVNESDPPYAAGKVTLYAPFLIRLVLDYAADVDQAINLIKQYNISFAQGTPAHFLIADCMGHSAIIEFVDNDMKIIRNHEPWQVSTNFTVSGSLAPDNVSCWRYNKAYRSLKEKQGNIAQNEAMYLLSQVSQSPPYPTMWSMVYNLRSLELDAAIDIKYSTTYHYNLKNFISN